MWIIESTLFFVLALCALVFVLAAFILRQYPPKQINSFYGYRTPRSMKNQQIWDFAQAYAAKEMMKMGSLLALFSLVGLVYQPKEELGALLAIAVLLVLVVIMIIRVERAIKQQNNKTHRKYV